MVAGMVALTGISAIALEDSSAELDDSSIVASEDFSDSAGGADSLDSSESDTIASEETTSSEDDFKVRLTVGAASRQRAMSTKRARGDIFNI